MSNIRAGGGLTSSPKPTSLSISNASGDAFAFVEQDQSPDQFSGGIVTESSVNPNGNQRVELVATADNTNSDASFARVLAESGDGVVRSMGVEFVPDRQLASLPALTLFVPGEFTAVKGAGADGFLIIELTQSGVGPTALPSGKYSIPLTFVP